MKLALQSISLPLAEFTLEVDITLTQPVTAIFGPSGAGKTSLLDLIAGLREPRSAKIQLDSTLWIDTERQVSVPPRDRAIGYVPQDLALFPHLNVRRNILYGAKTPSDANPIFNLDHVLDVLEIQPLLERRVRGLSGGEKQRVALARALMVSPRLLLLDEPLANLDQALKDKILPYLGRVRDEFKTPILYVTHDRDELAALADVVLHLNRGRMAPF